MSLVRVEWREHLLASGNMRLHWKARHRQVKEQRRRVLLMLKAARVKKPIGESIEELPVDARIVVTLTRVAARELDDDNLVGSFKGIRDEIAKHFNLNDRDKKHIRFVYEAAKGEPSMVRVEFDVEPANEN